MAVETLLEDRTQVGRRRKLIIGIILAVVLIHIGAGVVAGIFVVARYFTAPPAQFEVKRDIRLPAKEREHKMNMAEFDAQTPKPSFSDKMASMRPTDFALPDIPRIPVDQMLPLDPSEIMSDAVSSLVGTAGLGGGGEGAGGLGGIGDGFSFMGIESNAKRILLIFDVSRSVLNRMGGAEGMLRIKEQTLELLDGLGINTRFGLIQFTQNYQKFRDELVPASDQNKEAAREWIDDEWVTGGTLSSRKKAVQRNPDGLLGVLRTAYAMEPDVIFIVSETRFFKTVGEGEDRDVIPIEEGEIRQVIRDEGKDVPINFIAFEPTPEGTRFWRSQSRRTGGNFRIVEE